MTTPSRPPRRPLFAHYSRPKPSLRDRLTTLGIGAAVALAFLVLLGGVLWAFVRAPLVTFAGLVVVWMVGMGVFLVKRARERTRRELERQLQRLGKWGQH